VLAQQERCDPIPSRGSAALAFPAWAFSTDSAVLRVLTAFSASLGFPAWSLVGEHGWFFPSRTPFYQLGAQDISCFLTAPFVCKFYAAFKHSFFGSEGLLTPHSPLVTAIALGATSG
jgi:hypothetical protein